MASFSRHSFVSKLKNDEDKSYIATNKISPRIRRGVMNGEINITTHVLEEGERLDTLAMLYYQSSEYWWVIAAASGIGWSLQIPPGTLLLVPKDINDTLRYLR